MRTIDETYKMLALAPSRRIYCRAVFGTKNGGQWTDSRTYRENDYIISASIDIGAKSGGLEIGRAYCAKLTLRLACGASVSQSDQVKIGVGFLGADGTVSKWVQLGVFYVDTVKKSDNIITITAYDRMLRAQKFYTSSLTYPCKMSDMLGEICGQMGIVTVGGFALPIDPVILRMPVKGQDSDGNTVLYTRREVLSYIASACAGNFFFNGDGQLDLTDFSAVSENMAAENSISAEISDETFTVSGVAWIDNGISHSRYDEDTTGLMEFENPLPFQSKPPLLDFIDGKLTALSYSNGEVPEVYALNYNDTGRGIEGEIRGFAFDLVDADTVRILAAEDPNLLPEKTLDIERDKKWNVQKMNAEILQGIIQGEAIPEIANRLQNVTDMNRGAAVRNARTMVTGAENRGRLEAQKRAEADGVILEREWISANDGRTRDLHAELDGQTRKIGKPFEVGGYSIMYPGDPSAAPEMVYNCRCTTGTAVKGFKNPVTGKAAMI